MGWWTWVEGSDFSSGDKGAVFSRWRQLASDATLDIDASVLRALKERRLLEHKTLGQLVSEPLAGALAGGAMVLSWDRFSGRRVRSA